jgi:hypothetical protein
MTFSPDQFGVAKEKVKDLLRRHPTLQRASPRVGRGFLPGGGECIKVTLASRPADASLLPADVDGIPVVLEIAGEATKFAR